MAAFEPKDLLKSMNPAGLRVHAPEQIVFLCGGAISPDLTPSMRRDAFRRAILTSPTEYRVILAEEAQPLTTEAGYKDLFKFESDIAQVVGLILLFAESAGSLAELGAFAALETVAPSLLAVLDDFHYRESSFIRNGPIRFLENEHGEEWVLVLDRKELGIDEHGSIAKLSLLPFMASVTSAVERRLRSRSRSSSFKNTNSGHAIFLLTGLCQEFGALTISEIKEYLTELGVRDLRLENCIYCALTLRWIKRIRKGHQIFYVAIVDDPALEFTTVAWAPHRDKTRWRADIRAYWLKNEPVRIKAIAEAVAEAEAGL